MTLRDLQIQLENLRKKLCYRKYTVSTLPTGCVGMRAYVTDATAPAFLSPVIGDGTVVTPVFFNGTAWVAA